MNEKIERWDRWDTRLPNPKDQQRAIDLFHKSGSETKSDFVRGRILGESFKVIMVDKSDRGILPKTLRTDGTDPQDWRAL